MVPVVGLASCKRGVGVNAVYASLWRAPDSGEAGMVQSETGASHYWDWNSGREIYDYMTNRDDVMMPNDVTVSLGMRAVRCINDWEDLSEMDPDGSWAIKGLQCCVFVCDVSDRASLDLAHLKRLVARFPAANPSGQVDLVLVANKTDLPREEWQISPTMLHDTAAAFGATVVYISARSGWNCSGRKSMLWLTVLNLLYGPFDMPWNVELGHLRGLAALQIEPPIRPTALVKEPVCIQPGSEAARELPRLVFLGSERIEAASCYAQVLSIPSRLFIEAEMYDPSSPEDKFVLKVSQNSPTEAMFFIGTGNPHPQFVFSNATLESALWGSEELRASAICICCAADVAESADDVVRRFEKASISVARRFWRKTTMIRCREACDTLSFALVSGGIPRDVRRLIIGQIWSTRFDNAWAGLDDECLFLPRMIVCLKTEVRPWKLSQDELRAVARRLCCSLFFVSAQFPKSDAELMAPMLDLHRALQERYALTNPPSSSNNSSGGGKSSKQCAVQ